MDVAVIGLGNMGRAAAGRLLDRGHRVRVWNRSAGRAGDLVAKGAVEAGSPAEAVEGVEVALVVLTDDDAVASVCLGEGGAAAALGPSAVLADVSTVSPGLARRLAAEGPAGRVLDAPVLGAPKALAEGTARWLVGGPAAALDVARPVLEDLGSDVAHCGPPGAGAVLKLVGNLLLVTGVAAVAEGAAIARAQGIDDSTLVAALGDAPVLSPAARMRLGPVLDPEHPGWFGPALARKDVRLAAALAAEAGTEAPLALAAEGLLSRVLDLGDWPDFSAVLEAYRA